jgi:undecaprenyl-diphosphatase
MSFLEALILGIIQGLTEFLPVSSSGHLELAKAIQGQEISAESSMVMTVTLHAATALSTIVVFRKDLLEIFKGLFQFKANEQLFFSLKIIVSMVPAAFVGLYFNDIIEGWFDGEVLLVGSMLLLTGLLLFLADRAKDSGKQVGFGHALIIGISQAIAILPGISRSGATIGTSVLLGIDRAKAARFSFLMVVPLILGKMADDLRKGEVVTTDIPASMLIVGFIAAFITGILACTWMIGLVKRSKLSWFSYYCFAVGAAAILWNLLA